MMKRFVRSAGVQRALSATFSTYLKFVYATLRWTREGQDKAQGVWDRKGETGAILCLWHQGVPISAPTWEHRKGAQEMRILISKSSDGEFITQVMADIGFKSIRGSRRNPNAIADKGGATAFRDMIRWVRDGGAVALTPDGPKGPARIMGHGTPNLAVLTGAPVLLVGIACKPCIRAKTWDRTVLPLPFSRGAMVWDGPIIAPKDADVGALAEEWAARLTAVTERAEALLG